MNRSFEILIILDWDLWDGNQLQGLLPANLHFLLFLRCSASVETMWSFRSPCLCVTSSIVYMQQLLTITAAIHRSAPSKATDAHHKSTRIWSSPEAEEANVQSWKPEKNRHICLVFPPSLWRQIFHPSKMNTKEETVYYVCFHVVHNS